MDGLSQNDSVSPPLSQETFLEVLEGANCLNINLSDAPQIPIVTSSQENFYDYINQPFEIEDQSTSIIDTMIPGTENMRAFDVPLDEAHQLNLGEHETVPSPPIPGNFESYPGPYGFTIVFESENQPPKSVPWTYSSKLDQLFTNVNVSCPVQFNVSQVPPPGSNIRAIMYFKKQEYVNQPVGRCITHQLQDPTYQRGDLFKHVLRCEDRSSVYEEIADGPENLRMSVSVPVGTPNSYDKFLSYNYQFTCLSSCPGGMNRRQTVIVFTLEYHAQILGKRVLDARVCACPGRDRMHFEKRLTKGLDSEPLNKSCTSNSLTTTKPKVVDQPIISDLKRAVARIVSDRQPPNKKIKSESQCNDSEIYHVEVRGYHNYEMIRRIARALEMLDALKNHIEPNNGESDTD